MRYLYWNKLPIEVRKKFECTWGEVFKVDRVESGRETYILVALIVGLLIRIGSANDDLEEIKRVVQVLLQLIRLVHNGSHCHQFGVVLVNLREVLSP